MPDEPTRVDLHTTDLAARNRSALEESLPGVLLDGVLDAARLGELLDAQVTAPAEGRERFGLMWAGKNQAVRSLLAPSRAALAPDPENSVDFDTAKNVFVEGDSLEVLKLLQKAYNDQVKLVYIDPPYNTGNDFVYSDDFADGLNAYLEYTGQIDEHGNRTSTDADLLGRRHSRWLSMMYPRLVLARNLLRQDGVLAVSIDENELANLRSILDEIFGPENYLNTFVWVSNLKGRQIANAGAARTHEYIVMYARRIDDVGELRASATLLKSMMPSIYKGFNYEVKVDDRGPYVTKNQLYNTNSAFNEVTRPNLVYDIYYRPSDGSVRTAELSDDHLFDGYVKIRPKVNNNGVNLYHAFRWSREKVEAESHDLEFVEAEGNYRVYTKVRDVDSTAVKDLIMDISTTSGAGDLQDVGLDPKWFDYPKPVRVIQLLCACATDEDSLVLDFFAGSGTTAHAVAVQNSVDGGTRRCLSVNIPEPVAHGSHAAEAGIKTVSEITLRRLLGVSSLIPGADDHGLRVFSLGTSNFRTQATDADGLFDLDATTLLEDRDLEAVAAEILLAEGVPLDAPWGRHEAGTGSTAIVAAGVAVVITFDIDDQVVADALALRPRVLVFLEDGFSGRDAVKANAFIAAKALGITMKTA